MIERTSFVVVLHHENVSDESVAQISGFIKNFPSLTFTDSKDISGTTVFTPGGDQTRALETIMGEAPGYMPPKMMIDLVREDDFNEGNIPGTDPVTVKAAGDDNVVDATPESLIDQFNTNHNVDESGDSDVLVDGDDNAHTSGTDVVAVDDGEFFVPEVDGDEFEQEIDQILDRDVELFNRMEREDKISAFLDEILPSVRDLDGDVEHGLDLDKLNDQQRSIIESVWSQSRNMIESARSVASESVSNLDDYELDAIRLDLIDALAEADNQHINGFLADRDGLDELFELAVAHLIDHQRQNDREWEAGRQFQNTDDDIIHQRPLEGRAGEQVREMRKPYPWRLHDFHADLIVFKRDRNSVHRQIFENQKKEQPRQKHQIQHPVLFQICHQTRTCPGA